MLPTTTKELLKNWGQVLKYHFLLAVLLSLYQRWHNEPPNHPQFHLEHQSKSIACTSYLDGHISSLSFHHLPAEYLIFQDLTPFFLTPFFCRRIRDLYFCFCNPLISLSTLMAIVE